MVTEREPRAVWVYCAVWVGDRLESNLLKPFRYDNYDNMPQWLRERIAVLRLLENDIQTPMGMRSVPETFIGLEDAYWIVRQPGDPEWEEWQ